MRLDDNMKKIREELYIEACKEHDSGKSIIEVCRKYGISESSFYVWKKKFSGMNIVNIKAIKEEVKEEKRLKRKIKEQELIIKALRNALKKKF